MLVKLSLRVDLPDADWLKLVMGYH